MWEKNRTRLSIPRICTNGVCQIAAPLLRDQYFPYSLCHLGYTYRDTCAAAGPWKISCSLTVTWAFFPGNSVARGLPWKTRVKRIRTRSRASRQKPREKERERQGEREMERQRRELDVVDKLQRFSESSNCTMYIARERERGRVRVDRWHHAWITLFHVSWNIDSGGWKGGRGGGGERHVVRIGATVARKCNFARTFIRCMERCAARKLGFQCASWALTNATSPRRLGNSKYSRCRYLENFNFLRGVPRTCQLFIEDESSLRWWLLHLSFLFPLCLSLSFFLFSF